MSKIVAEDCKQISVYKLKRWGYLQNGFNSREIYWTNNYTGDKSCVSLQTYIQGTTEDRIRIFYRIRVEDNEWNDIKHDYSLVSTPCHFGKKRLWFICSVYKSGYYCGRRVAKLYLAPGNHYFACRHCYNLTYRSRIQGYAHTEPDLDRYYDNIKKFYYRGEKTKKYLIYLRKMDKLDNDFAKICERVLQYKC